MGGDISIHITIVGSQSTGKSTLVYQYTGRNYLNSRMHTKEMQPMTTIHSVKHKDKFYELCIRDTCGSSMSDMRSYSLCANAEAVIICFDLLKPPTLDRAKRWITDLTHSNNERCPILLLIGTTKYPNAILSKHSTDSQAQTFAQKNNIYYHTVCFAEANEIPNIFTTIIETFTAPSTDQTVANRSSSTDSKSDDDIESSYMRLEKLKEFEADPEALKIKLIMLGDSGVGKTTFRCRLETNSFDAHLAATIGVDYSSFKTIEPRGKYNVEVELMDPSGLEAFKTITRQFYRGIHGVIVFCDVTSINSWNNTKYWMDEILYNCSEDVVMMLLCNKMDLAEQHKALSQDIIDKAKQCAETFDMKTYNISCKEGEWTKNVWRGFGGLVNDIVCNKQLFLRLTKEQGFEALGKLQSEFPRSISSLSVDGRPYNIQKGTIKRTCTSCDFSKGD
eukprot:6886_1